MQFTEAEGKAFWPLYEPYRAEMEKQGDALLKLVKEYGQLYPNVPEDRAKVMLKDLADLEKRRVETRGLLPQENRAGVVAGQDAPLRPSGQPARPGAPARTRRQHPAGSRGRPVDRRGHRVPLWCRGCSRRRRGGHL